MNVLVTDADGNHALSVVRSLGQQGITVGAADSVRWAKTFSSRYCAQSAVYTSPALNIDAFLRDLYSIVDRFRPSILMPMTEKTIMALIRNHKEIESRVKIAPLPSVESLGIAFDKGRTIDLAKSLGIAVPETSVHSHLPDFKQIAPRFSYPVVIKPRCSEITTSDKRIVSSGTVAYCMKADDLSSKYLTVHRQSPFPLIQEFVPGDGYGICVLCNQGNIKALFAHRRLRTVHPTGSGSSLRESITPPEDMADATRALVSALNWHGVAMIEFKRDARDNSARLMEINGRFWNSLPLAVAAGVDFPKMLYTLATTGDVQPCTTYRAGVKCRWLAGDIAHTARVMRGPPPGWTDEYPTRWRTLVNFLKFYGKNLHYDNLWASDPLPFFTEMGGQILNSVSGILLPRRTRPVAEASRGSR